MNDNRSRLVFPSVDHATAPKLALGPGPLDPRSLPLYASYRRFRHLALTDPNATRAEGLGRLLFRSVAPELGTHSQVLGIGLYRRVGDRYLLQEASDTFAAELSPPRLSLEEVRQATHLLEQATSTDSSRGDESLWRNADVPPVAALLLGAEREVLVRLHLAEPFDRAATGQALLALQAFAHSMLLRPAEVSWLEQARTVQTSLLPTAAPRFPGFEIEVRSRPAQIVGGDLFDFPDIGPENLGLLIGDACGHGLPAALQARDIVVGVRMGAAHRLRMAATLDTLSRLVASAGDDRRFVSLFLGELDTDGNLLFVNAGHVAPWILGPAGEARPLVSSGPVLGLPFAQSATFQRRIERLYPGELLVAYTDGITEVATGPGEEWGAAGLTALVRSRHAAPLPAIADDVFDALDALEFGGAPDDDQTLLLIRRTALPG